jgi:hypothetical protein
MKELDGGLLSLIVGLTVYVSSIRFVVISRLIAEPAPSDDRKTRYKTFLKWLVPADVLLVVSGVLLFIYLYWGHFFSTPSPDPRLASAMEFFIPRLFAGGLLWLVGHHAWSWLKTLRA